MWMTIKTCLLVGIDGSIYVLPAPIIHRYFEGIHIVNFGQHCPMVKCYTDIHQSLELG